jgi:hypothetical protein
MTISNTISNCIYYEIYVFIEKEVLKSLIVSFFDLLAMAAPAE